ncbi:uncharacterized protein LOC131941994 [Physella acuta]|uniref:uncharacterized protein LOC131941994 n=1 Tax=Physella acuta TaxID=109671 RepID=UPI0027DC631E|nr:uncharacterized protein LOC131941994 [Physella acuta]
MSWRRKATPSSVTPSQTTAQLKDEFFDWMKSSFANGDVPYSVHSIVRNYRIGHLKPAWEVRLQVKNRFAELWGTDQLLSSVGRRGDWSASRNGRGRVRQPEQPWAYTSTNARPGKGLHAYQGAVYLETADEDDWTFEVLEGSHEHLEAFYAQNTKAAIRSVNTGLWRMRDEDISWYLQLGCRRKRVPARAGDLLLWDSRLVHANARPIKGREHNDRWR